MLCHYNDTQSTMTYWSFDNDQRHVTAFWPIRKAAHSWSYDNQQLKYAHLLICNWHEVLVCHAVCGEHSACHETLPNRSLQIQLQVELLASVQNGESATDTVPVSHRRALLVWSASQTELGDFSDFAGTTSPLQSSSLQIWTAVFSMCLTVAMELSYLTSSTDCCNFLFYKTPHIATVSRYRHLPNFTANFCYKTQPTWTL